MIPSAVTVDRTALPHGRLELDGRGLPRPPRKPSLREGAVVVVC